jgi:hypothetical protein
MAEHGIGRIWINDVEIQMVERIEFDCAAGDMNRLRLCFMAKQITFTGPAKVSPNPLGSRPLTG